MKISQKSFFGGSYFFDSHCICFSPFLVNFKFGCASYVGLFLELIASFLSLFLFKFAEDL